MKLLRIDDGYDENELLVAVPDQYSWDEIERSVRGDEMDATFISLIEEIDLKEEIPLKLYRVYYGSKRG